MMATIAERPPLDPEKQPFVVSVDIHPGRENDEAPRAHDPIDHKRQTTPTSRTKWYIIALVLTGFLIAIYITGGCLPGYLPNTNSVNQKSTHPGAPSAHHHLGTAAASSGPHSVTVPITDRRKQNHAVLPVQNQEEQTPHKRQQLGSPHAIWRRLQQQRDAVAAHNPGEKKPEDRVQPEREAKAAGFTVEWTATTTVTRTVTAAGAASAAPPPPPPPTRTVLRNFEVAQPVLMPHGPADSDGTPEPEPGAWPPTGEGVCATVLLMRRDFAWSYNDPFVGELENGPFYALRDMIRHVSLLPELSCFVFGCFFLAEVGGRNPSTGLVHGKHFLFSSILNR